MTHGVLPILNVQAKVAISSDNPGCVGTGVGGGSDPSASEGVGKLSTVVRAAVEDYSGLTNGGGGDSHTRAGGGEALVVELDGFVGPGDGEGGGIRQHRLESTVELDLDLRCNVGHSYRDECQEGGGLEEAGHLC
jgi:hypothetical protein